MGPALAAFCLTDLACGPVPGKAGSFLFLPAGHCSEWYPQERGQIPRIRCVDPAVEQGRLVA